MKRFRRLLILWTTLIYGLVGGGPSLWALGLEDPMPAACSAMGCTCDVDGHGLGGKACCCKLQSRLLNKFPGIQLPEAPPPAPVDGLQWNGAACDREEGASAALAPLRPHLKPAPIAAPTANSFERTNALRTDAYLEAELAPLKRPPRI